MDAVGAALAKAERRLPVDVVGAGCGMESAGGLQRRLPGIRSAEHARLLAVLEVDEVSLAVFSYHA
ncbi:hypothetical protein C498_11651 [Haloferax volcanii DS2]|uniref:Uncharacterized protein n=1 Tax=Haloferax volcanii (strain ATCC 29605 / DSM 3757 / JCM 8879 / NBRC 14742 / NCIMB 2012 / VKM B-1768 / DS2) TaxID=309800 RepID=L9UUC1_HALVD|nr:hypothetical protein C498_11651 [Haloferax volcanii DS2]